MDDLNRVAAKDPSQSNPSSSQSTPVQVSEANDNLQRIQQRKQQVFNWPQFQKLIKLANYSTCQIERCQCNGWKNPQPKSPKSNANLFHSFCKSCNHTLESHVTHLQNHSDEELNELLRMAIDIDNAFMGMQREEDPVKKQVYNYLFRLLRKFVLIMNTNPIVEGPLGHPPFERPSISQAIMNFVAFKFGHLAQREWHDVNELAKLFLDCLNCWNFEPPSTMRNAVNAKEAETYKIDYTRWLVFCRLPVFFDSLPRYDTTLVFGRTLLRTVFKWICEPLMDKCRKEKDDITSHEKRVLVFDHFPKYVGFLADQDF